MSNDIAVGYNWLEELREGLYQDDRIGAGSPYLGPEAKYDGYINENFRNKYKQNFWPKLRNDPTKKQLIEMLNEIHEFDFNEFSEMWVETRKNTPPFYEWFSMLMYIKRETINKIGLFDEQFVPSNWEDLDFLVKMNNADLFRISVTSSYAFHFGMITNRNEWKDNSKEYNEEMLNNTKRFAKKWRIWKVPGGDEQGNKYQAKEPLGYQPWPVADSKNNILQEKWYTWDEWNLINKDQIKETNNV